MKKIIFICGENAGRSQMAEAFFNKISEEKNIDWLAESAGTYPAKDVNPIAVEAMGEEGINIRKNVPKLFDFSKIPVYDKIISFGCIVKSSLPEEAQRKLEEWHIEDPREKDINFVRKIRDEIKEMTTDLLKSI
jgi:arsenate reductase (thioredoxin)